MRIAVVEDEREDQECLLRHMERFFKEENMDYQTTVFDNAVSFLENYRAIYDIVFLDIQMPGMNGMDAAEKLRKMDAAVPILFVTNMAQYAVKGYDVDAIGFVVKPLRYYDFYLRMRKAVNIAKSREEKTLVLTGKQGIVRISVNDIYYVEVIGHSLYYHTKDDTITVSGSISAAEEKLKMCEFLRCNNCYLVNPRAILYVQGHTITLLNKEQIQISHPRKKEFMTRLNEWLGEGKNL